MLMFKLDMGEKGEGSIWIDPRNILSIVSINNNDNKKGGVYIKYLNIKKYVSIVKISDTYEEAKMDIYWKKDKKNY